MKALRSKKYLAILVIFAGIISLNLVSDAARGFMYQLTSPFQGAFWNAGDAVDDFLLPFRKGRSLQEENERLQRANIELKSEIVQLGQLQEENEHLRASLELGMAEDFSVVQITVLGKQVGEDTFLTKIADSPDLVEEGMPVITPEKMAVGEIVNVEDSFATVQLLSHPESSVGAEIQEKDIRAVAEGQGRMRILFRRLPRGANLENGDMVSTSGVEDVFPPGLLIGSVADVQRSDVESDQTATIKPEQSFYDPPFLFVVTSF